MAAQAKVPIKLSWHDSLVEWLATGPPGIPGHSPGTVLAVASARMRYASRDGTECYPTRQWLADLLGYHRDTVRAVDQFLEANGWCGSRSPPDRRSRSSLVRDDWRGPLIRPTGLARYNCWWLRSIRITRSGCEPQTSAGGRSKTLTAQVARGREILVRDRRASVERGDR